MTTEPVNHTEIFSRVLPSLPRNVRYVPVPSPCRILDRRNTIIIDSAPIRTILSVITPLATYSHSASISGAMKGILGRSTKPQKWAPLPQLIPLRCSTMCGLPGRGCQLTNLTARRLPTATAKVAYYATVLCGDRAELQVFPSLDLVPQQDGNRRHEHKNPSLGT